MRLEIGANSVRVTIIITWNLFGILILDTLSQDRIYSVIIWTKYFELCPEWLRYVFELPPGWFCIKENDCFHLGPMLHQTSAKESFCVLLLAPTLFLP